MIAFAARTPPAERDRILTSAVGLVIVGQKVQMGDGQVHGLPQSTGTCFAVTRTGHLVTNKHVVRSHTEAKQAQTRPIEEPRRRGVRGIGPRVGAFFGREGKFPAEVAHASEDFNLALLKIDRAAEWAFALAEPPAAEAPSVAVAALAFPGIDRVAPGVRWVPLAP